MLTDFYVAFATVCFTLLGLWIIVVQTRHGEWRQSAVHRRRAYGVALHFSLPGLMSLLSLVDPAQHRAVADLVCHRRRWWRPGPGPGAGSRANRAGRGGLWGRGGPVSPDRPGGGGAWHGRRHRVLARPLRVEAVLLTMLVFLGVNVAWLLLFDEAPPLSSLLAVRRASHWSPSPPLDTLLFSARQGASRSDRAPLSGKGPPMAGAPSCHRHAARWSTAVRRPSNR
jgi:hypothetical protein